MQRTSTYLGTRATLAEIADLKVLYGPLLDALNSDARVAGDNYTWRFRTFGRLGRGRTEEARALRINTRYGNVPQAHASRFDLYLGRRYS